MADLETDKISILNMTNDALVKRIVELRTARRNTIVKRAIQAKEKTKAKKSPKKKGANSIKKLIANMSKEDMSKLLQEISEN